MQLRTYTGLWNVEKRLYKFYDVNLPYPVSLRQLGTFAVTAVPWAILMTVLHVPFEAPWHLLWLAPPVVAMIYANRPVAEGKTLTDFLLSQVRFFLSARVFNGLQPEKPHAEGQVIEIDGRAWERTQS